MMKAEYDPNDPTLNMSLEQIRQEIDEFRHAADLVDEGDEGCDLCGEMVPYLRWTKDARYLVCEVCWSEYGPDCWSAP